MQKNIKKETKSTHNSKITTDNIFGVFPSRLTGLHALSVNKEIYVHTLCITGFILNISPTFPLNIVCGVNIFPFKLFPNLFLLGTDFINKMMLSLALRGNSITIKYQT